MQGFLKDMMAYIYVLHLKPCRSTSLKIKNQTKPLYGIQTLLYYINHLQINCNPPIYSHLIMEVSSLMPFHSYLAAKGILHHFSLPQFLSDTQNVSSGDTLNFIQYLYYQVQTRRGPLSHLHPIDQRLTWPPIKCLIGCHLYTRLITVVVG